MSIFGPREDDPLLQDDPLAASADEESANEAPPGDEVASEDTAPDDSSTGRDPAPRASESKARCSSDRPSASTSGQQSVFSPSGDGNTSSSNPTDDCVIVRPVEKAADGQLTTLNAALDEGWRLRRVELRDVPPDHTSQSTSTTLSLAFVLHRPDS